MNPVVENPTQSKTWPISRKRLVLLALISLMVVTIAGSLWAFQASPQANSSQPNQPQASSSASPTPTLSEKELQEQKLFAAMPQSMLYYSFSQTNNARNVFQANPTDTQRRTIEVGFPGGYQYLTSPDGQQFIRYSNQNIQWTSAKELRNFITIFQPNDGSIISSAIYSSDSQHLAVVTTKKDGGKSSNTIYRIENKSSAVLTTAVTDAPFKLLGYVGNQSVWFATNYDGQLANLSSFNLQTQATDSTTYALLNTDQLLSRMTFNRTMTAGYSHSNAAVNVFDLSTKQSRTLAQVPTTCPNRKSNLSAITGFSPSLTTNRVLVSTKQVACGSTDAKATYALALVDTATGQTVRQTAQQLAFNSGFWSVNNDYVWAALDADHNYMVNIGSLSVQSIPDAERQLLLKEKLYFTGWLTGEK